MLGAMLSIGTLAAFTGPVSPVPTVVPGRVPAPSGGTGSQPRPPAPIAPATPAPGEIMPPRILPRGSLVDLSV